MWSSSSKVPMPRAPPNDLYGETEVEVRRGARTLELCEFVPKSLDDTSFTLPVH